VSDVKNTSMHNLTSDQMPVVFIGHGSPMAAFEDNVFTRTWAALGQALPRPKAILCVSAHWYVHGARITAMQQPRTIHDFQGFPDVLYQYHYPASGEPLLAQRIVELLKPMEVIADQEWGFDHGSWTLLKHMYPLGDVPLLQLSIDRSKPADWHYELGRRLAVLRTEGVLILGSGNVVHNLRYLQWNEAAQALPWAREFDQYVRAALERGDHQPLVSYQQAGEAARLSVPTPDHYLPLLYVLGASEARDSVSVLLDEIVMGSISMMSVVYGHAVVPSA